MTRPAHDKDITWHHGSVDPDRRAALLGQRGCVVWMTGLSGSGKSTIAHAVERRLVDAGHAAYVLDGDNVRHGLSADLGFSAGDREENIRRVSEVAALLADAGLIAVVSFIAPYCAGRQAAREKVAPGRFLEVFVDAPVAECARRDPKGLYRKAAAGEIDEFTGVSAPYEPPEQPDLTLRTNQADVNQCMEQVLDLLAGRGLLSAD